MKQHKCRRCGRESFTTQRRKWYHNVRLCGLCAMRLHDQLNNTAPPASLNAQPAVSLALNLHETVYGKGRFVGEEKA